MKLKTISAITGICGAVSLLVSALMPMVYIKEVLQGGTSIVGGADGPTYQYAVRRLGSWPTFLMLAGGALVLTALFCLLFSSTVRKHCRIPTTVLALGMSASGILGLCCFLECAAIFAIGSFRRYPIRDPACVITGILCAYLLVLLAVKYYHARRKQWSGVGLALDIAVGILYLPCFFQFVICVDNLLS